MADPLGPEYPTVGGADHDAHIGPKTILVDDIQGNKAPRAHPK
jgi:hypothetical protein